MASRQHTRVTPGPLATATAVTPGTATAVQGRVWLTLVLILSPAALLVRRPRALARLPRSRAVGIALLLGIATTHLTDLHHKMVEAPYLAILFMNLIGAALIGVLLLASGRYLRATWKATAVLSALTIAGYIVSRSVGLPQIPGHIGDWTEPAGIASLVYETAAIGLAVGCLAGASARRRAVAVVTALVR